MQWSINHASAPAAQRAMESAAITTAGESDAGGSTHQIDDFGEGFYTLANAASITAEICLSLSMIIYTAT